VCLSIGVKGMSNKRVVGKQYEERAKDFLVGRGYIIAEQNFTCRTGEIDIIAWDDNYLVFVEVKYRRTKGLGLPEEAVNFYKQKKITETARYYIHKKRISTETPCRFDVVSILGEDIQLIPNAFEAV
jgi:putative endonuclease